MSSRPSAPSAPMLALALLAATSCGEGRGLECIDLDGDGYGEGGGCLGPDCDDDDAERFARLEGYPDLDGDGLTQTTPGVFCAGEGAAARTAPSAPIDCDDDDPGARYCGAAHWFVPAPPQSIRPAARSDSSVLLCGALSDDFSFAAPGEPLDLEFAGAGSDWLLASLEPSDGLASWALRAGGGEGGWDACHRPIGEAGGGFVSFGAVSSATGDAASITFGEGAGEVTLSTEEATNFLTSHDPDGALLWARELPGLSAAIAPSSAVTAGGFALSGIFSSPVSVPLAPEPWERAPEGREAFVAGFTAEGAAEWVVHFTGLHSWSRLAITASRGRTFALVDFAGPLTVQAVGASPVTLEVSGNVGVGLVEISAEGDVVSARAVASSPAIVTLGGADAARGSVGLAARFSNEITVGGPEGPTRTLTSSGPFALLAAELTLEGELRWARAIQLEDDGAGEPEVTFAGVHAIPGAGLVLAGELWTDVGETTFRFGEGAEEAVAVANATHRRRRPFIARYDAEGELTLVRTAAGEGRLELHSAAFDSADLALVISGRVDGEPVWDAEAPGEFPFVAWGAGFVGRLRL